MKGLYADDYKTTSAQMVCLTCDLSIKNVKELTIVVVGKNIKECLRKRERMIKLIISLIPLLIVLFIVFSMLSVSSRESRQEEQQEKEINIDKNQRREYNE